METDLNDETEVSWAYSRSLLGSLHLHIEWTNTYG